MVVGFNLDHFLGPLEERISFFSGITFFSGGHFQPHFYDDLVSCFCKIASFSASWSGFKNRNDAEERPTREALVYPRGWETGEMTLGVPVTPTLDFDASPPARRATRCV